MHVRLSDFKDIIFILLILGVTAVTLPLAIPKFVKFKYTPPLKVKGTVAEGLKVPSIKKKPAPPITKENLIALRQKIEEPKQTDQVLKEDKQDAVVVNLNLNMILVSERGNIANINNIFVKEGDFISIYKVEKITKEGVMLSRNGETKWLNLR